MAEHQTLNNFEFHAAGRTWTVPAFRLDVLPDGTTAASMAEFDRVHRSIVNAICGRPGPLSAEEFEFLCDVCDVPYAEVARLVGLDRSALTKWMQSTKPMRVGRSNQLKQWFLLCLFGDRIGRLPIRAATLIDADEVLAELHDEVIRSGAADPIGEHGIEAAVAPRYHPRARSAVSSSIRAFELAPVPSRTRARRLEGALP